MISLLSSPRRFFRNLRHEFRFKLNAWTLTAIVLGLLVFIPMAEVLWQLTDPAENWEHLKETVLGRYLKDSLILVAGTVFLSVVAGVSCAWLVTCCEFPGRKLFEWALVLPLAVPTFIAAYAYFDLLDRLTNSRKVDVFRISVLCSLANTKGMKKAVEHVLIVRLAYDFT